MPPPLIFISYSHADAIIARQIKDDLTKYGAEVWLDEIRIGLNERIFDKIRAGIEKSNYLAVLLSPTSVASKYVADEIDIALAYEKQAHRDIIIPLVVAQCQIPDALSERLWVDFSPNANYTGALAYLLHKLGFHDDIIIVTTGDETHLTSMIPLLDHWQPSESSRDYLIRKSVTLAAIEMQLPTWSRSKVYFALYELVKSHKIEIFIDEGLLDSDGHPSIREGSKALIPYFSKGDFPPGCRPTPEKLDLLFRLLRESMPKSRK